MLAQANAVEGLAWELAAQYEAARLRGEIFKLAQVRLAEARDRIGQSQHRKSHVPRFVGENLLTDSLQERVLRRLGEHAEEPDRERLGDELKSDRLDKPLALAEQIVEQMLDVAVHRIDAAAAFLRKIAAQHLGMARFVDDLRALEEFRVVGRHHVDELAACEHRALLAMKQLRNAPA